MFVFYHISGIFCRRSNRKKIVPYSLDYIEEIHFGRVDLDTIDSYILSADCFCTNAEEIRKAENDLAYSLAQDESLAEEAKKNGVKFLTVILNPYEEYTVFGNFENGIKVHGNKILDFSGDELATFDTPKNAEKVADELKSAFENNEKEFILPTIEELNAQASAQEVAVNAEIENASEAENSNAKLIACIDDYAVDADAAAEVEIENAKNAAAKVKAKVAEILNRPRKKIIDWSGTFEEMKISEILSLQKDFKKYLKLGQIELAENIFSMLKTLCKNYRGVAA